MSKLNPKNQWIAAGSDAGVMSALCEHLPPSALIVTTRAELQAQMEALAADAKKRLLVLDDSMDAEALATPLNVSVLYLKAPSSPSPKLKAGSTQVIEKPVVISDLARHVRRLLSQIEESGETAVSKLCTLLKARQLLTNPDNGMQTDLTEKEAQILEFLCRLRPEAATREQLHREVWGYQGELNTHTLETHIYRLRSKLKEIGATDVTIDNTASGYKLSEA